MAKRHEDEKQPPPDLGARNLVPYQPEPDELPEKTRAERRAVLYRWPMRPPVEKAPLSTRRVPAHPLAVITQTLLEFYLGEDAPWRRAA